MRNLRILFARLAVLVLALAAPAAARAQLGDGIYAEFDTNMGSFTARLDYALAPRTVASFVGLVEGSVAWMDEATGQVRNDPYFDGIKVNRIADLPSRIIQTGSQNGTNSGGGPGYTFRDEFHPGLRHDKPGIISMANSGLNSNGTQHFFILGPTPHLDDKHNVFGEVISGLNVLTNIGNVALNGSIPVEDVVFEQVRIVRIGTDASNFDTTAHGIAVVSGVESDLQCMNPGELELVFPRQQYAEYYVYGSPDLAVWSNTFSQFHTAPPPPSPVVPVDTMGELEFCAAAEVLYPGPLFTPEDIAGARFLDPNGNALDVQFDAAGTGGTVSVENGQFFGNITFVDWVVEAYRGVLLIVHDGFTPPAMCVNFVFTAAGSGHHSTAELFSNGNVAFSYTGNFQFTPPAP